MTSAVYIALPTVTPIERWDEFCQQHNIGWSSHTMGQSTYYVDPQEVRYMGHQLIVGKIEVKLDRDGSLEERVQHETLPDGRAVEYRVPIWETARPPTEFGEVTVSTFWTWDPIKLEPVARLATQVVRTFGATWTADPELRDLMQQQLAAT
jgi:hypothetical protein